MNAFNACYGLLSGEVTVKFQMHIQKVLCLQKSKTCHKSCHFCKNRQNPPGRQYFSFFLSFCRHNNVSLLMQIVWLADDSHEISSLNFAEKIMIKTNRISPTASIESIQVQTYASTIIKFYGWFYDHQYNIVWSLYTDSKSMQHFWTAKKNKISTVFFFCRNENYLYVLVQHILPCILYAVE